MSGKFKVGNIVRLIFPSSGKIYPQLTIRHIHRDRKYPICVDFVGRDATFDLEGNYSKDKNCAYIEHDYSHLFDEDS